ncbi:hypothetical protein O4214_08960 [Rhodococcus erythropolis]|nr:hypothetical protein [Rhodococcus qingshengii]MCZ4524104.1 hypothetical protein [Rhodococcus erythropolis]
MTPSTSTTFSQLFLQPFRFLARSVNVVQQTPPPGQIVSDEERLRGMTYL